MYEEYDRNDKFDDYDYCDDCEKKKKKVQRFKEVDKVCIGCPKPCITEILKASVKVELKDYKIEKHCDGFKLIVKGCKYIKICYCSNDKCACDKLFTEIFVVPFCESIDFCGCYKKLCGLDIYADKCVVKKVSSKCAVVKSEIVVEPDFRRPKHEDLDCDWDCNCKVISQCDC